MLELPDPREEKACNLRASGKSQIDAYNETFEVPDDSKANNSSRFFRQHRIRSRVAAIKRRRATLADINEGFVLHHAKAIAKQGALIGNANLDDYFVHTATGARIGISLEEVPRAKMAALDEVTIEQYTEGPRDDPQTIKKTKIKLKAPSGALTALKMIGDYLGMWAPTKIAPTNPKGDGPPLAPETTMSDIEAARRIAFVLDKIDRKTAES